MHTEINHATFCTQRLFYQMFSHVSQIAKIKIDLWLFDDLHSLESKCDTRIATIQSNL